MVGLGIEVFTERLTRKVLEKRRPKLITIEKKEEGGTGTDFGRGSLVGAWRERNRIAVADACAGKAILSHGEEKREKNHLSRKGTTQRRTTKKGNIFDKALCCNCTG